MSIPEELARREARRRADAARAKATIEARAKERHARERAEYEAKLKAREAKTAATGKKPRGRPPAAPTEGPLPTDQVNLTDEESRIMPVAVAGSQGYNAQAMVAEESAGDRGRRGGDNGQMSPASPPPCRAMSNASACSKTVLADTGFASGPRRGERCKPKKIEPLVAIGRTATAPAVGDGSSSAAQGQETLRLTHTDTEPVFGIIKWRNSEFRVGRLEQCARRVNLGPWPWNIKRMFVLASHLRWSSATSPMSGG